VGKLSFFESILAQDFWRISVWL